MYYRLYAVCDHLYKFLSHAKQLYDLLRNRYIIKERKPIGLVTQNSGLWFSLGVALNDIGEGHPTVTTLGLMSSLMFTKLFNILFIISLFCLK